MQVAKRDGRIMEFNKERIVNAILKAMMQTKEGVDEELANKIANSIEKQLENRSEVSVYEIQDLVEKKLMVSSRKEVATAYITYRYTRDIARKSKTRNIFLDIITSKSNPLSKEGAYQNVSEMMKHFAAESIKPYVDTMLLSKEVREAEKVGYINIRNKSYYPTKAIRSFVIPLSPDWKLLKDCKNIESAVCSILSIANQLDGEVCESLIFPPIDEVLNIFEKKTYQEELQNIKEILTLDEKAMKDYQLLAEKQAKNRVHNSLKFLFEGLSALHKSVTFLDSKEDYSVGKNVVNAVEVNLPRIAFELFNFTKDMNLGLMPDLKTNEEEIIEEKFVSSLKKCIEIAVKAMAERWEFQATGTKSQFPTLMSGLWQESEALNEEDTLVNVLRYGTLELEVLGIEESIRMLHGDIPKLKKVMVSEINRILEECSKQYHLNFTWKETKENQEFGGKINENS